jgi:hypothetical protein
LIFTSCALIYFSSLQSAHTQTLSLSSGFVVPGAKRAFGGSQFQRLIQRNERLHQQWQHRPVTASSPVHTSTSAAFSATAPAGLGKPLMSRRERERQQEKSLQRLYPMNAEQQRLLQVLHWQKRLPV